METTPEKYQQYVRQKQKKSPLAKDLALAFLIGGLICVVGQLIQDGYAAFVDTNNIPGIDTWLEEQGIARNTGILGRSGFCTYPLMLFDTDRF